MADEKTNEKNLGSVTLDGGKVVKIAKPTMLQVKAAQKFEDDAEQEAHLISSITGISVEELEGMLYDEYTSIAVPLNSFLYRVGKMREEALA
ncbi:phage tail assembly protein [Sulfurimonas sp.]|uniref:phage tail assembly protein n=1 Tax=Sulfurimonas sp. TaxID=2022749 RepID=UPI002B483BA4|nr:phage tail assembly protein [Sulfurimonas sp.]